MGSQSRTMWIAKGEGREGFELARESVGKTTRGDSIPRDSDVQRTRGDGIPRDSDVQRPPLIACLLVVITYMTLSSHLWCMFIPQTVLALRGSLFSFGFSIVCSSHKDPLEV